MKLSYFITFSALYLTGIPFTNGQRLELNIGDTLPSLVVSPVLNYTNSSLKFPKAGVKVTLIDFWSTWCVSCIKAFPKLDSLQQEFGDTLSIVPVTYELTERISKFCTQNALVKNTRLPLICNDTLLSPKFKNYALPCVVWVDEQRVIKAVTNGSYVNRENIRYFLNTGEVRAMSAIKKKPFPKDIYLAAFVKPENGKSFGSMYSICSNLSSYYSGAVMQERNGMVGVTLINQPILQLYYYALFCWNKKRYHKNTRLEVNHPDRFIYQPVSANKDIWEKLNTYCFEAWFPSEMNDFEKCSRMLEELNKYFGLYGRVEQMKNMDEEEFVLSELAVPVK